MEKGEHKIGVWGGDQLGTSGGGSFKSRKAIGCLSMCVWTAWKKPFVSCKQAVKVVKPQFCSADAAEQPSHNNGGKKPIFSTQG